MQKKDENKKSEQEDNLDIDIGIGKISLGGMFKGLERLVELASKLSAIGGSASGGKEAGGEMNKEGEVDLSHLKKGMKAVYGFTIKSAVGGKPVVEPFGNVKQTPKGPTVDEEREPMTDVFDEKEEVKIYAEMPGVNEADIKVEVKGDILDIAARSGDRKYHKEVLLPAPVKAGTLTSSYKNGILEIRITK